MKVFIFETFRIKHVVADQASQYDLNVLKEIEIPGRVKLYIGLVALWYVQFISYRGFLFKPSPKTHFLYSYTWVGSGKYCYHRN